LQAAFYAATLWPFFRYDAWIFDEPGDWNLCRRMYEAGVKMQFLDKIVATVFYSAGAERKTVGTKKRRQGPRVVDRAGPAVEVQLPRDSRGGP
jgi:hypothetical protein